jgi:hypothetical protein
MAFVVEIGGTKLCKVQTRDKAQRLAEIARQNQAESNGGWRLELGLRILPVGRVRTDDLLYFGQSRGASCKSNSGQLGASVCKDKALQISAAGTALPEADIGSCAVVRALSIWGHTVRSNLGSKIWVSSIKSSKQIEDNVQFKASFLHPSQAI